MSQKEIIDKLHDKLQIAERHSDHMQFVVLTIPEARAILSELYELKQELYEARSPDLPS